MTLFGLVAVASLARPWIGIAGSYVIVLLVPQEVWWWQFQDTRPALWLIIPTIVGLVFAFLRKEVDLKTILNRRNLYMLILWLMYVISYYFGPYVDVDGEFRFTDASWSATTVNKIFVLYFLACLCIDDEKKLRAMIYVFIGSGAYLVFWINHQYLSGAYLSDHYFGRIGGPTGLDGAGIYSDENNFAMLFVVVSPFFWFMGFTARRKFVRWALWLVIPFTWHAIFLTGSRGGLVGIAATIAIIIWRSNNRKFALLLVPAFAIAFAWQAGDVMRDRAGTISEYRTESSAASRIEAWEAAGRMIIRHPVTGVGLASFGPAFPDHSKNPPREAHNTFLQISAESGIVAGIMYLSVVASCLFLTWRNGRRTRMESANKQQDFMFWINESVLVGFFGLVVCSLFLSLQLFEIFYFLCLLVNATIFLTATEKPERHTKHRAISQAAGQKEY